MTQCIVRAPIPTDDGASFVVIANGFPSDGYVYLAKQPVGGTNWVRVRDAATVFPDGAAAKGALVSMGAQQRMSGEEIVALDPLES